MSKVNHPTQTCRTCNGTGKEVLTGNPLRTYRALKEIGPATCYQVSKHLTKNGSKKVKDNTVLYRVHQTISRFEKNGLVKKVKRVVVNDVRRPAWEFEVV